MRARLVKHRLIQRNTFPKEGYSEPLLTVAGYNAMTELGRISSIIRRVTDDSVAAKLEEEGEEPQIDTN